MKAYQALCLLFGASALLVGCPQPQQAGSTSDFDVKLPDATDDNEVVDDTDDDDGDVEEDSWSGTAGMDALDEDQKAQIEVALRRGRDKAAQCPNVVEDAPKGEGEVTVIFDGKKGRAVDAEPGAPFAGSSAEDCIKRAFVGEIVLPFDGQNLRVPTTVKLE